MLTNAILAVIAAGTMFTAGGQTANTMFGRLLFRWIGIGMIGVAGSQFIAFTLTP